MKPTYELSEPCITSASVDRTGHLEALAIRDTTRDKVSLPVSRVPDRKEVLAQLIQRIAKLPASTQKMLALYYHENLPLSEIAACFNRSQGQICELFSRALGSFRHHLLRGVDPDFGDLD